MGLFLSTSFHGLDLFVGQRRQQFSLRTVVTDTMSCDHEGQCLVQVLMDDHLASSQGGAPFGTLQLHHQIVKAHGIIPINGLFIPMQVLPVPRG